jgi:hypothetical protein
MDLRAHLLRELDRRRARNPRYSLRAFARQLGTDHTALARLLHSHRRLTPARARSLGARLGLAPAEIDEACRIEGARLLAALVARPDFRPDSRWIATRTGLPVDDVNIALQRLLHARRLHMVSTTAWTVEAP